MKLGKESGILALEARVDQQAGLMRIGNYLFYESVAIGALARGNTHTETMVIEVFGFAGHVTAYIVEKTFAVAHQELQVADLGQIDGGEINLVDDARRCGVPDAARSGIRGADDVLGATRPSRRDARRPKRLRFML